MGWEEDYCSGIESKFIEGADEVNFDFVKSLLMRSISFSVSGINLREERRITGWNLMRALALFNLIERRFGEEPKYSGFVGKTDRFLHYLSLKFLRMAV